MFKKLLVGGTFAVVVIGVILVILFRKNDTGQESLAAEAVPPGAVLFIDQVDYTFFAEEFRGTNQFWNEMLKHSQLAAFDSITQRWTARIGKMPLVSSLLNNGALSMSLHLQGKNTISAIFYVQLGDDVSSQEIKNEILMMAGNDAEINTRKYEAIELTDVSLGVDQGSDQFSYVLINGLLIAGRSSLMLEDAIRTLHSGGGIYHQKGFQVVAKTAGKYVLGNLYLNYAHLHELFFPFLEQQQHNKLKLLETLAGWGEFDLELREDVIILNGMTQAEDSAAAWLSLVSSQSPVRMEITSFVPSNITDFLAIGLSDVQAFQKDLMDELIARNMFRPFQAMDQKSKEMVGESMFSGLLGLVSDEIACYSLEDMKSETFAEVAVLEVRSRSEAMEKMTSWVSAMAGAKDQVLSDYTSSYALDDQVRFDIYRFPEMIYKLPVFQKIIKSHFAFYDNYVILSDSEEAISRTIYQNVLHKTLENEVFYENINNLISTRANVTRYFRPAKYLEQHSALLDQEAKNLLNSLQETLRKIPGLIMQFSNEGDIFYSNISLSYSPKIKEKALTVWESLLDSTITSKPWLVTNHYTSEKEIMVQDASGSLYLVNSTGRVLWQVPLDGPVLSDVYQVDYYRNGKLQYLFNTPQQIHLIDRNGNYVERYPVKLRADATNGIALYDYDKRREYRIFVAGEDRKVYVYDIEGNTIPGWTFRRSEGFVRHPVQHFRIGEKDFILFADGIRAYILDRRGKERIKIKESLVVSKKNQFYLDMNISGESPRFVTTDTTGKVMGISINGEVEQILEHSAAADHYFRVRDLDQDGKAEMIFVDDNTLEVVDLSGRKEFSFKTRNNIRMVPDIYEFSTSDLKIGIVDSDKNQIYLLNSDGTLYEGFPLDGNTRFSIGYFAGSDSRFNLIVGSLNGFLYNYSIE